MRITTILLFEFCCFCIVGCEKTSNRETSPSRTTDGKATYQSRSATDWIMALKSPDSNSRLNAIEALHRIYPWEGPPQLGVSTDIIDGLREALDDPVDDIRIKAGYVLRGFATEEVLSEEEFVGVLNQKEAVGEMHMLAEERSYYPMLLPATDGTWSFSYPVYSIARFEAAMYLGRKAGSMSPSTVAVLERLKSDKDPAVRFHSAVALFKIRPGSSSPVGLLEESLESEDAEIRFWAAHALVEAVGRKAQVAIGTLLDCIADPNYGYYERDATVGLLQFGPEIMPAYLEKLRLPFENSIDWIFDILYGALGDEMAVEYLAVGLKDSRPLVRLRALELLYFFSEHAEKCLPAIIQLTEDEDPKVRWQALLVFHSACSDAEAEVPVLAKAFGGKHLRERTYAAWALGHCLLAGAAEAALILFEGLKDPNESVRDAVGEALAIALGTRRPEIAEMLLNRLFGLLKQEDPVIRESAVQVLSRLGPRARVAIPILTDAIEQGDQEVREIAEKALKRITRQDVPIVPVTKERVPALTEDSTDQEREEHMERWGPEPEVKVEEEELSVLVSEADLVVVATKDSRLQPYFEFGRALKGSTTLTFRKVQALEGMEKVPVDNREWWILFLRVAQDGGDRLYPVAPTGWFMPSSRWLALNIIAAIPLPEYWGKIEGGARMGLRLRKSQFAVGEDIPVEICIHNVEYQALSSCVRVFYGHRFDLHDYYPYTRFIVESPDGKRWELTKPAGEMKESDFTSTQQVSINGTYVHTVRLNRWSIASKFAEEDTRLGFVAPGSYNITCIYSVEQNPPYEKPWRSNRSTWSGTLVSNTVEFVIVSSMGTTSAPPLTGTVSYWGLAGRGRRQEIVPTPISGPMGTDNSVLARSTSSGDIGGYGRCHWVSNWIGWCALGE